MRWARAALVLCFVLVIASISTHGFAREMARKCVGAKGDERKSSKESAISVGDPSFQRGKSKKLDLCCGNYNWAKKNMSMVDVDERVVPTGPNPLHNR